MRVGEKAQLLTEGLCQMAMDQSGLLELLEMLKPADVDGRIRVATENEYRALIEQHDGWAASDRHYFSSYSMALLTEPPTPTTKVHVETLEVMTA